MGHTGGSGQGTSTPVSIGTTGLAPSQAHELVNGKLLKPRTISPKSIKYLDKKMYIFPMTVICQRLNCIIGKHCLVAFVYSRISATDSKSA